MNLKKVDSICQVNLYLADVHLLVYESCLDTNTSQAKKTHLPSVFLIHDLGLGVFYY